MARFKIDSQDIHDGRVLLSEKESRHAATVLRLKLGDSIDLIDGKGLSLKGIIVSGAGDRLVVELGREGSAQITPKISSHDIQITLAVSAIKSERMELLIQKACELGVHAIIPMRSERSIIKLSRERWTEKIKRWRKIAIESCKQCGLAFVPEIGEVTEFKDVFEGTNGFDHIFIPTLTIKTDSLYDKLASSNSKRVLVLIGPEGDFSPKEASYAVSKGALPVSLGPLVLRTETAAIYIMSVLSFFYREINRLNLAVKTTRGNE